MTFTFFRTESGFDYLRVMSDIESDTTLQEFTGPLAPGYSLLSLTPSRLAFWFSSDESIIDKGFSLVFSAVYAGMHLF